MTETREPYETDGLPLEERFALWAAAIPDEFRRPEPGSPRARILAAAAEHFARDGFSRSTTRAIAETAGVNQAMIHYYFQSKTGLYEHVLAGLVVDLLSMLAESMVPGEGSAVDTLVNFPERIVAVFSSDPVRLNIFRREIGGGAPRLRAVVERLGPAGPHGFRTLMTEFIDTARSGGNLAAEPATTIMPFLLVHAYGTLLVEPVLREVLGTDDSPDEVIDFVTRQRGLLRRALTAAAEEDTPS
jgi:AcrR family transcriptional regulator